MQKTNSEYSEPTRKMCLWSTIGRQRGEHYCNKADSTHNPEKKKKQKQKY